MQLQIQNVAHAYARIADAIRDGKRFEPDFDQALKLHQLLEAFQHPSDQGRTVELG